MKNLISLFTMSFIVISLHAQVAINTTGDTANPSAALDITSTTQGMLMPRMSTTQRTTISTPATGLLVFDITTNSFWYYDGSAWADLSATAPIFGNTSGVTSNENGTYASDDFVFGSTQLDDDANTDHDSRFFFDKSKAAFRAGKVTGTTWDATSIGAYSFAVGQNTKASGNSSTAMGHNTKASNYYATAMGDSTVASERYATAMGYNTEASGRYTTAMGYSTNATGSASTAMGYETLATDDNATAMGKYSEATGYVSTAMGYNTNATGDYATAMGSSTEATGNYAIAMGSYTEATGDYATAMGYRTDANGKFSTAMGYLTAAESGYETAIGSYNTDYTPISATGWDAADRLFVIGNGTYPYTRSDAMVVLKNGNTGFGTSTPDTTLHIVGGIKYIDGNEGAGKVLTSDANGNATWGNASARVVTVIDASFQTIDASVLTGYQRITSYSGYLSVAAGDVIVINTDFRFKIVSGSGTDEVQFRILCDGASGCSDVNGSSSGLLKVFESFRGDYMPVSQHYTFTATCSGTYRFALQVSCDNSDDELKLDEARITAVKH